jgi:hypothetical protein
MGSQATSVGLALGVLTTLVAVVAIVQGIVLSVESLPVAAAAGILAGALVGGIATIFVGGSALDPVPHRTAVAATLLGAIALVLFLGISSAGIANTTALLVGVGVGGVVAIGSYLYLRDRDAQNVKAVTM